MSADRSPAATSPGLPADAGWADRAPAGWDAWLQDHGGDLLQSTAWAGFQRAVGRGQPVYLQLSPGGGATSARALGFVSESSLPALGRWTRGLQLDSPPLVSPADEGGMQQALRDLEALARAQGCSEIEIHAATSGVPLVCHTELGYVCVRMVDFQVDLDRSEAQLWRQLSSGHRRKIRRAQRAGLEVVELDSEQGAQQLRRLQLESSRRQRRKGNSFEVAASDHYRLLHQHLLTLGRARLLVARQRGRVLAACLFADFNQRSKLLHAGSGSAGNRLGAPALVFWEAPRLFRGAGHPATSLGSTHLGADQAWHPQHGLYRFWRAFAARERRTADLHKVLTPWSSRLRHSWQATRRLRTMVRIGAEQNPVDSVEQLAFRFAGAWTRSRAFVSREVQERLFDARAGVRTRQLEPVATAGISPELQPHINQYGPSPLGLLRHIVRSAGLAPGEHVFVDIGSGKGRVLIEAEQLGFRRTIGVEIDPALHHLAQANLAAVARRRRGAWQVQLILDDAGEVEIPADASVFFFGNPFDSFIFKRVLDNISASLQRRARDAFIIYANPLHGRLLDEHRAFRLHCSGEFLNAPFVVYRGG